MKRKITIIYLGTDGRTKKEFLFSPLVFKIISGILIFLLLGIITGFVFLSLVYNDALQKRNYERKLKYAQDELKKIEKLKSEIEGLYEKNEKIKDLLGIDIQSKILKSHTKEMLSTNFDTAKIARDSLNGNNDFIPDMNPVNGEISRGYSKEHPGVDIAAEEGMMVISTIMGTVEGIGWDDAFGNYVLISNENFSIFYGHLQKVYVKKGQNVKKGEIVGTVGNTGKSSAPHLHYEVRKGSTYYDPMQFLKF